MGDQEDSHHLELSVGNDIPSSVIPVSPLTACGDRPHGNDGLLLIHQIGRSISQSDRKFNSPS